MPREVTSRLNHTHALHSIYFALYGEYAQLTTPLFMCLKCGTGPGRSEQHIMHMLVKIAAAVHTLDATDFKLSQCFDDHFWQNAKMVT